MIGPGHEFAEGSNASADQESIARPEPVVSVSLGSAVGLSLAYSAAYFLPQLTATQAYFLTSQSVYTIVVLPSLLAIGVITACIWTLFTILRIWASESVGKWSAVAVVSVLSVLALKGIAEACGYHWQDSIPRGHDFLATQQHFKYSACAMVVALVWFQRLRLPRLIRVLSSLGFAFGALAAVRLFTILIMNSPQQASLAVPESPMQSIRRSLSNRIAAADTGRPRRVVWILFDETDFNRAFGVEADNTLGLPNFRFLSRAAVFATDANSPASATLYSIPSLLTGIPIDGKGIRITPSGLLRLERTDKVLIPFNEANSLFGVLNARNQKASVLGFLHPYCQLFLLERCNSFIWPEAGYIAAGLMENAPDALMNKLRHLDYWSNITRDSLGLLPEYIARDDALTFVHLNIPHLPAHYADASKQLPESSDPLLEYSRNLQLADEILGQVIQAMQEQVPKHELLLVVSTDHWLRNRWYQADKEEVSRPVPLIVWKVGETRGIILNQPISTVHTSEMILDYLNGDIADEAQIADWWRHQAVFSSFIAPNT